MQSLVEYFAYLLLALLLQLIPHTMSMLASETPEKKPQLELDMPERVPVLLCSEKVSPETSDRPILKEVFLWKSSCTVSNS